MACSRSWSPSGAKKDETLLQLCSTRGSSCYRGPKGRGLCGTGLSEPQFPHVENGLIDWATYQSCSSLLAVMVGAGRKTQCWCGAPGGRGLWGIFSHHGTAVPCLLTQLEGDQASFVPLLPSSCSNKDTNRHHFKALL